MEIYELEYKIENDKSHIRILGEEFFMRNKIYGYFIYKNIRYKLKEIIETKNIKEEKIKIELRFLIKINNKNNMFKDCISLTKFSFIKKEIIEKNSNIIKIYDDEEEGNLMKEYIENNIDNESFYNNLRDFESSEDYSDILQDNQANNNISNKSTLKNIVDIMKVLPENLTDLSGLFYNCKSLISIEGISDWDTSDVTNLNGIFYGCSSLKSLPDISSWDTGNVKDLRFCFYGCSSLLSLPDISTWSTNKVINMEGLFYNCSSLLSIPDISKWNINNNEHLTFIFFGCSSLKKLPDLSKWKANQVKDMIGAFYNCSDLLSLPDISKWNTDNVSDISYIFNNC